jgi:hypothetical protein
MPCGSIALDLDNAWLPPLSNMLVMNIPCAKSIVLIVRNSDIPFVPQMLKMTYIVRHMEREASVKKMKWLRCPWSGTLSSVS